MGRNHTDAFLLESKSTEHAKKINKLEKLKKN